MNLKVDKSVVPAFLVFLSSAICFSIWFKVNQVSFASAQIPSLYPLFGYLLSSLEIVFLLGILWLVLVIIGKFLEKEHLDFSKNLFHAALPFLAFLGGPFGLSISVQFFTFVMFVAVFLIFKLAKTKFYKLVLFRFKEPISVLVIFTIIYLILFKSFSPLYHESLWDGGGRLDYFTNIEHQMSNAKANEFLDNFSQQGRLGGYAHAQFVVSEALSLIVMLLDLPLVDYQVHYAALKLMFFALFIFGSFGCYLFLRHGLKFLFLPSFVGGLGFIFANTSFVGFLNYEYTLYLTCFTFFPWVLLILNKAHSSNRKDLLCLAGLFASLAQYTMSSHPETELLFIGFCNIYNVYLSCGKFVKGEKGWNGIGSLLSSIIIFPLFHFVGMSYRLFPLFYSMGTKEFALFDSVDVKGGGFWWAAYNNVYYNLFFRVDNDFQVGQQEFTRWAKQGLVIPYYLGQFTFFLIIAWLSGFFTRLYSKYIKKEEGFSPDFPLRQSLFFVLGYLILAGNLPPGIYTPLAKLLSALGLRVHELLRLTMYYGFFAMIAAMFGFEYLLRLKEMKGLKIACISYLLVLGTGYFLFRPITMTKEVPDGGLIVPDLWGWDLGVIFLTVLLFYLHIKYRGWLDNSNLKGRFSSWAVKFLPVPFVLVAMVSFLTINSLCSERVLKTNHQSLHDAFSKGNVYKSFLVAVMQLENNPQDDASFEFMDQWINKVKTTLDYKMANNWMLEKDYLKYMALFEIGERATAKSGKLEFYRMIAPELDRYHMADGPTQVPIGFPLYVYGPMALDLYNGIQFYFPNKYQLYFYSGPTGGISNIVPKGKNSELMGGVFYGVQGAYPAIHVNFYFKALYPLMTAGNMTYDFNYKAISLEHLAGNKEAKKLLDIMGADFFITQNYLLDLPSMDKKYFPELQALGFEPGIINESYKYSPRFSEAYNFKKWDNSTSYGRAYIAKWVKVIDPSENMQNLSYMELPKKWPRSDKLLENFRDNIAKIPDGIWRAALIESSDPAEAEKNPKTFDADNTVEIKRIIGSKAVFNVDCQEESCWFVYNTAALAGWSAYSGSTRLPIQKANLGFIGVKLDRGNHFL